MRRIRFTMIVGDEIEVPDNATDNEIMTECNLAANGNEIDFIYDDTQQRTILG